MNDITRIALTGSMLLSATAPAARGQIAETAGILNSDDWQALKEIWRMLDRVKPSEDDFSISMATEKGDSLNTAILNLFSEEEIENSELEFAISMVRNITSARVNRLSRVNTLMITRMMPPWNATVQSNLMFNFENRISTVTSLAEAGEITPEEFAAARDSLLEKAETLALLEILDEVRENQFYDRDQTYGLDNPGSDEILQQLDMSYRIALDSLQAGHRIESKDYYLLVVEQHEEFLQKYEDFQQAKPILRILLFDLMEVRN